MNFRHGSETADVRIELTPLIDVVFQLLIFFLLTSSFVAERAFEVELPEGQEEAKVPKEEDVVTVTIASDGAITHAGRAVSLVQLKEVIRQAGARQGGTSVLIRGDRAASHGRVVEVMDLAHGLGVKQLAIAIMPKSEPQEAQ